MAQKSLSGSGWNMPRPSACRESCAHTHVPTVSRVVAPVPSRTHGQLTGMSPDATTAPPGAWLASRQHLKSRTGSSTPAHATLSTSVRVTSTATIQVTRLSHIEHRCLRTRPTTPTRSPTGPTGTAPHLQSRNGMTNYQIASASTGPSGNAGSWSTRA
eukprot:6463181-Prymnesium_polylepis.1